MCRRTVFIEKYRPPGRNNRRSLCENNPKGCRFGRRYDRGTAANALFALNQRNLSITGESGKSSRMAFPRGNRLLICYSEWPVNLQVINPVRELAKARGKKSMIDGSQAQTCLLVD